MRQSPVATVAPSTVGDRLREAASEVGLDRLGILAEDRDVVRGWLLAVAADPAELEHVAALREAVLLPALGAWDGLEDRPAFPDDTRTHPLGRGVLPLCALAATADDAVAELHRRGVPDAVGARALTDLGQQVAKDRRVNGTTGLHNQDWLRVVWSGGFLWVGRLQFEPALSRLGEPDGPQRRVLSVHIPATGPLDPVAVDSAFTDATALYARHYPYLGPVEAFVCHSWLLDPALPGLVPGSNVAAFARRWTTWRCTDGDRDACYFAFDTEPPPGALPDLDALPGDSMLRRALLAHWRTGGHLRTCSGRAVR